MFDFRPSVQRRPLSLTPLIDVVFILLLFFMLASNFDQWQAVGVSSTDTLTTVPSDKPASVIQLRDNGTATFDDAVMSDSDIAATLRRRIAADAAHRVRLIPAAATTVQELLGRVDLIRATGVEHLGIDQ